MVALAAVAAGCGLGPSEVDPAGGIRGAVTADDRLSRFAAAIPPAQLIAELDGGDVTVFAPTDVAFRYLGTEAARRLENDPALFGTILRRHIVRGRIGASALTDGAELPTLAGPPLVVRHDGGRVTVGGIPVTPDPFDAGNGLLYRVDGLFSDHLDAFARLQIIPIADRYADLLRRAGVLDRLRQAEPVTVFAPINEGILGLSGNYLDLINASANGDIQAHVARVHLAPGRHIVEEANATLTVASLDGHSLTIEARNGALTVNGVAVVGQPVETANGVIYLLRDAVLDGLTLEQRLRGSTVLRSFTEWALGDASTAERLRGTEPLTLFAPTNFAIAALLPNVVPALQVPGNLPLLRRIVATHLAPGALPIAGLVGAPAFPSLEGSPLSVSTALGSPHVNGRRIVRADIRVRNGVIHVIEGLLQPNVDAFDAAILRGTPAFAAAVRQANLEALLRSAGPLSVFAVTDEAAGSLLGHPDAARIIRFHLVDGLIPPLADSLVITPMEGPDRLVTFSPFLGFLLDGFPLAELGPVTNGRLYSVRGLHVPPP